MRRRKVGNLKRKGKRGKFGAIRSVHVGLVMVEDELWDNRVRWGTWEELILGGAVLRHGSHDWDAVALEVQARTLYPCLFTPQVCKAKYEDLQERYSGSSSWFEELRKRRVEELRRALEKSEDSIGSLESKLETLKIEKDACKNAAYSSSRAESTVFLKSEGNESSGKEASKDGLSAGSFTQETQVTWSPQCEAATKTCAEEARKTHEEEKAPRLEKFPSIDKLAETIRSEGGVNIRRRRGKRKRKDLSNNGKEGSIGENNLLGSADIVTALPTKEVLANDNGQTARSPKTDDQKPCTSKHGTDDFMKILDSIMENEHASVFRRRLDSQKRARYKKMIRQHMDLEMIRARITRRSITSPAELHRDLLLLANNALVFYSKCTREYKCALMLRDLATKKLQHSKAIDSTNPIGLEAPTSPMPKPPAKPRSARPFNQKFGDKAVNTENGATIEAKRPPSNLDSPSSAESSALMKKSPARKGKVGRVRRASAGIQAETPMKVRKKARVK